MSLLLFFFASIAAVANNDLPTADEIQAGYRQNLQNLGATRITWEVSQRYEPAYRENLVVQLNSIEAAIKDSLVAKEYLTAFEQKKNELKQFLGPSESLAGQEIPLTPFYVDFWTDGANFQARVPREADFPKDFKFPEMPIRTPADLEAAYSGVAVLSFSSEQEPKCWVWQGLDPTDERLTGTVTDGSPDSVMRFRFPPLGFLKMQWGKQGIWHPIDQFLAGPLDELQVIDETKLDGQRVIVVERKKRDIYPGNPSDYLETVVRGWVDPIRGYLPLKLESRVQEFKDGKATEPLSDPIEVVTVSRIDKVANQVFYPFAGKHEYRQSDSRPGQTQGSSARKVSMYTYITEQWEVSRVNPREPISKEMFLVGFPEGTRYFNHALKRFSVAGTPQKVFDRIMRDELLGEAAPKPIGSQRFRPWLIGTNLIAVLALAAMVFYVRMKARRA